MMFASGIWLVSTIFVGSTTSELGAIPITGDARQFAAMLVVETERWRKVVEMSGQKKE